MYILTNNFIQGDRIATTYMSRLEVKNDTYTVASDIKENQHSIEKFGNGLIMAYESTSTQIYLVKTDEYY